MQSNTQIIPQCQKAHSIRDDILMSTQYPILNTWSQVACGTSFPSFLHFSLWPKQLSRGTFAFPLPYPQADSKVPNETEHTHSRVAVTQSRLVWEHRSSVLFRLTQSFSGSPHPKGQIKFRKRNQIQMEKTSLHLRMRGNWAVAV